MTNRLLLQRENWQRLVKATNRAAARSKRFSEYERPYEIFLNLLFWKYICDLKREYEKGDGKYASVPDGAFPRVLSD